MAKGIYFGGAVQDAYHTNRSSAWYTERARIAETRDNAKWEFGAKLASGQMFATDHAQNRLVCPKCGHKNQDTERLCPIICEQTTCGASLL